MADAGERGYRKREFSIFNVADRLPVDADKFGKALLGENGSRASRSDVFADKPEDLTVSHPLFESRFLSLLTSNMFDVIEIFMKVSRVEDET